MTRKRMMGQVKERLDAEGLSCDNCRDVADVSVDATLDYMLEFTQTVAQELAGAGLYTEAMVTGLIINRMKELKSKDTT